MFFKFNAVPEIYTKRSADMYFAHSCIIIILAFSFFNGSLLQKKNCKSNGGWYLGQTFRNFQGKWKVLVS